MCVPLSAGEISVNVLDGVVTLGLAHIDPLPPPTGRESLTEDPDWLSSQVRPVTGGHTPASLPPPHHCTLSPLVLCAARLEVEVPGGVLRLVELPGASSVLAEHTNPGPALTQQPLQVQVRGGDRGLDVTYH